MSWRRSRRNIYTEQHSRIACSFHGRRSWRLAKQPNYQRSAIHPTPTFGHGSALMLLPCKHALLGAVIWLGSSLRYRENLRTSPSTAATPASDIALPYYHIILHNVSLPGIVALLASKGVSQKSVKGHLSLYLQSAFGGPEIRDRGRAGLRTRCSEPSRLRR